MFNVWNLEGNETREGKKARTLKALHSVFFSVDMNAIEIYLFHKHYIYF